MASQTSVVNFSLLQIGARAQISSLDEGSTEADAASTLYTPIFQALARSAHWNCLAKQATLSLWKAAAGTPENQSATPPFPPPPWLYSYLLPSDCLKVRMIVPTLPASGVGGIPLTGGPTFIGPTYLRQYSVPFQVAYDTDASGNPITVILTNLDQAQAVYTVDQPNPVIWDPQFQLAFSTALAAWLVPALNLNLPLMSAMAGAADKMIGAARAADGNEGTYSQNREASWILARAGTSGAGWLGGNGYVAGWDAMCYPSGC